MCVVARVCGSLAFSWWVWRFSLRLNVFVRSVVCPSPVRATAPSFASCRALWWMRVGVSPHPLSSPSLGSPNIAVECCFVLCTARLVMICPLSASVSLSAVLVSFLCFFFSCLPSSSHLQLEARLPRFMRGGGGVCSREDCTYVCSVCMRMLIRVRVRVCVHIFFFLLFVVGILTALSACVRGARLSSVSVLHLFFRGLDVPALTMRADGRNALLAFLHPNEGKGEAGRGRRTLRRRGTPLSYRALRNTLRVRHLCVDLSSRCNPEVRITDSSYGQ